MVQPSEIPPTKTVRAIGGTKEKFTACDKENSRKCAVVDELCGTMDKWMD